MLRTRAGRSALVSPPVALTLHVFARILAEIGRTEDEDLEALRPAHVASPRAGRDAHHVPLLDLDDLVVELHPPAPAHDDVQLLLRLVRVAVREAIAGRDALVAEAGPLEPERLARVAELQVRRAVEVGPEVLEIRFEVPARERHGRDRTAGMAGAGFEPAKAEPHGLQPRPFDRSGTPPSGREYSAARPAFIVLSSPGPDAPAMRLSTTTPR